MKLIQHLANVSDVILMSSSKWPLLELESPESEYSLSLFFYRLMKCDSPLFGSSQFTIVCECPSPRIRGRR